MALISEAGPSKGARVTRGAVQSVQKSNHQRARARARAKSNQKKRKIKIKDEKKEENGTEEKGGGQ